METRTGRGRGGVAALQDICGPRDKDRRCGESPRASETGLTLYQ